MSGGASASKASTLEGLLGYYKRDALTVILAETVEDSIHVAFSDGSTAVYSSGVLAEILRQDEFFYPGTIRAPVI